MPNTLVNLNGISSASKWRDVSYNSNKPVDLFIVVFKAIELFQIWYTQAEKGSTRFSDVFAAYYRDIPLYLTLFKCRSRIIKTLQAYSNLSHLTTFQKGLNGIIQRVRLG